MEIIFNNLTDAQKQEMFNTNSKIQSIALPAAVTIIIAFMGSAVANWVVDKLIEYGAKRFCQSYKNYNFATKGACEIVGY